MNSFFVLVSLQEISLFLVDMFMACQINIVLNGIREMTMVYHVTSFNTG